MNKRRNASLERLKRIRKLGSLNKSIAEHPVIGFPYKKLTQKLQKITFGKYEMSLYLILTILVQKVRRETFVDRAYAVAFNLTMAVFPFLIFLFTLIPYMPINNLGEDLFTELYRILPESIYETIIPTVKDIVSKRAGGLLSFGFITAAYLATNGMISLMNAFNRSYKVKEKRNFFKQRLIAFLLTFILTFLLLLSIALLVIGEVVLRRVMADGIFLDNRGVYYLIEIFRYVIMLLGFYFSFWLIYYAAPFVQERWKDLSVGAAAATVLSITVSIIFGYYVVHFANYNRLYGSIGTMIGFMFWLFTISLVILIGFEINVSILRAREMSYYLVKHRSEEDFVVDPEVARAQMEAYASKSETQTEGSTYDESEDDIEEDSDESQDDLF